MATEVELKVKTMLQGGLILDEPTRRARIRELGPEGLAALRRIAAGDLEVEHPKLRLKAVAALGFDDVEPEATRQTLKALLAAEEAPLALHALRALGRSSDPGTVRTAREIVANANSRPDIALAAARITARAGGLEVVAELRALRTRLLAMVPNEHSPSIQSLDRMIAQASGEAPEKAREEPKLDV